MNMQDIEKKARDIWFKFDVYSYKQNSTKPVFSVDTPPPYVSAAHLHVGHAMSYTQAEIIVRYKRMCGYEIFYPMGFDDNGLPTERYVETTYKIQKKDISRQDFRQLCMEETKKGAAVYQDLWQALGLSVDWTLKYSTIDERCQKTSQKAFIELYKKNKVKRTNQPVLWDTHFETALAQADLEPLTRPGVMYDIAFEDLIISTTRPELLAACVALFCHPDDKRYTQYLGHKVKVPLFHYEVPILASEDVDPDFGTGLMMVCTFGDGEDVKKWKDHKLETRLVLTSHGRMNDLAGPYAGMGIEAARKKVVEDLGLSLKGSKEIEQTISIGERSQKPVEFMMSPQWCISVLEQKEEWLKRAQELQWHPEWMRLRLEQWINNLKYDWNISRQRFYGVPFPVWYVQETGDVILADEDMLPVDPTEQSPPQWALEKYKGLTIVPESDVMDTWMTSSLTPFINANWAGDFNEKIFPMSLRVQAFEIIRTWLFYTMIQSHEHKNQLPWKDVMISGWGLNEQGKKISKRDLTGNRYDPYTLIQTYGADALRMWASSSQLGHDLKFNEKDVKDGRKVVVKLANVAQLIQRYVGDSKPAFVPLAERNIEDQWIIHQINELSRSMTEALEKYDYAGAKESLLKFFWKNYCDDYLEIAKVRFWEAYPWDEKAQNAARCTLFETCHTLVALFAPYIPFITEDIYQNMKCFETEYPSIHIHPWPSSQQKSDSFEHEETMDRMLELLYAARRLRSDQNIGPSTAFQVAHVGFPSEWVGQHNLALRSIIRAQHVQANVIHEGLLQAEAPPPVEKA